MAAVYKFTNRWQTSAPVASVWKVLEHSLKWPFWWDNFESVQEIKPGGVGEVGSIRRYTLRSISLYRLTIDIELTHRVDFRLLSGKATGALEGHGTWEFDEINGLTIIECHWNVHTRKFWMNLLGFVLRPAFIYNHNKVMARGAFCLAKQLGFPVTVIS